jgi:hypothetical protein
MSGRVNRSTQVGKAAVNVIANWTDLARIEDVEEAIKQAARDAVRGAREAMASKQ